MSGQSTIVTADDHQMFLDGLRLILKQDKSLKIVGEAASGQALLRLIEAMQPDLAITDLSMGDMKGADLVKTIKSRHPQTKVLVITMHDEEEIISEILFAEAEGYLLKNSGKAELLEAVSKTLSGKTHYNQAVLSRMITKVRKDQKAAELRTQLSEREQEILGLIMREYTSKEIADELFISKLTVDKHRAHIMEKTGAKTLVGLIKYAIASGLAM